MTWGSCCCTKLMRSSLPRRTSSTCPVTVTNPAVSSRLRRSSTRSSLLLRMATTGGLCAIQLIVLVGSLNPDERLQINHIPGPQGPLILSDLLRKSQQARIGFPVGLRSIDELEAVHVSGPPRDIRLQEH